MTAIVLSPLKEQERIVERGLSSFVEVGNALMRIRDGELYREAGFHGFVEYLESKPWGISRGYAYNVIESAQVSAIAEVTVEAQARELAPLMRKAAPEVVKQVYAEVVDETEGRPTASAIRGKVKQTLKEMLPSTPVVRHNNKADNGVVQYLIEIKALIPKWDQSALDTLSASECRRRVQLAQVVTDWLTTEFLPAHEPRVAPLSKVPT